jgi:hypothetical protein
MSCKTCTDSNRNRNTPNLMFAQNDNDMISIHADYPIFNQISNAQFNELLMELGRTNMQVSTNSQNLVKMGKDMTIMGKDATWFGKEITLLKNKPSGGGFSKSQVEGIIKNYHGDDIDRLDKNHSEQEKRITEAYEHRLSIENKVDSAKLEHQDFHSKFDNMGIALQESKKHRDSIESKVDNHSHGDGGGTECAIWDIQCQIKKGISGIAVLGALGVGGFLLLKKL